MSNQFGGDDIDAVIQGGGITFRAGAKEKSPAKDDNKVRTKTNTGSKTDSPFDFP